MFMLVYSQNRWRERFRQLAAKSTRAGAISLQSLLQHLEKPRCWDVAKEFARQCREPLDRPKAMRDADGSNLHWMKISLVFL